MPTMFSLGGLSRHAIATKPHPERQWLVAPAPIFCTEKKALLDQFMKAVSEYLRMRSAQTAAVRKGDGLRFQEEIETARDRKDAAKLAVKEHLIQHGC